MEPITFEQKNRTYAKPKDMTDEECASLETWEGTDTKGHNMIISLWMPSAKEIEDIKNGNGVWLSVYGQGMPPVSLYTENPFTKYEQALEDAINGIADTVEEEMLLTKTVKYQTL